MAMSMESACVWLLVMAFSLHHLRVEEDALSLAKPTSLALSPDAVCGPQPPDLFQTGLSLKTTLYIEFRIQRFMGTHLCLDSGLDLEIVAAFAWPLGRAATSFLTQFCV